MRTLMWFRDHDLRSQDNTALYYATKTSTQGTLALFIICEKWWQQHDMSAARQEFILRQLPLLQKNLANLNIPFYWLVVKNLSEINSTLIRIAHQEKINAIFFNHYYGINEQQQEKTLQIELAKLNITAQGHHDYVIMPPGSVLTQKKQFFSVFTPFKQAWLKLAPSSLNAVQLIQRQPTYFTPQIICDDITPLHRKLLLQHPSLTDIRTLWPVGEDYAQQQLHHFAQTRLNNYQKNRDFPALSATSQLSPYLTNGIISIRQCLITALHYNNGQWSNGNLGALTWINELIWREFYQHVLYGFPRVSMHLPFQLATKNIAWQNDKKLFHAWKCGQTGYPIIDAAMRQLNQTAWMHNRLRMVVAMFLSKNLLIDWRWGEQYFMQKLIDGELAANNGGWQWAASTGTDAVPYFRIFNPITQSQRFDPHGIFIKQYCPELSALPSKIIHFPHASSQNLSSFYPAPIVDLNTTRQRAINIFRSL